MAKGGIKQAAIRRNALYYIHKRARTGQGHDYPFYPGAGQSAVQQPALADDQQAEYFSGEENEEENEEQNAEQNEAGPITAADAGTSSLAMNVLSAAGWAASRRQ